MKILAGIVLFNPEIVRLKENIDAIITQVDNIYLIDNGSLNVDIVEKEYKDNKKIIIEKNIDNKGIATALEQIFNYAIITDVDWVLTLDQDSVCSKDLICIYKKYININNVAIITCNILDRNRKKISSFMKEEYKEVKTCITSASFMSVAIYKKTDGFDRKMFIDGVDFEMCTQVRLLGYKVIQVNYNGVLHEIGHGSRTVKVFGRSVESYNHLPFRHYYMARNRFYLSKKYPDIFVFYKQIRLEFYDWLIIITYEKDRKKKIIARLKGICDTRKMQEN